MPEFLMSPSDSPAVAASQTVQQELIESDASLARITEDLIDILIQRGVIQFTDFPPAAQAKLLERRQTRVNLSKRLKLLDESDGLI
jgi:hypothetical protein